MTPPTAVAGATPQLSHFGIFVRDIAAMTRFYTEVFGLRLTDQGEGRNFRMQLHFLSGSPQQHHQLVLASGRGAGAPSTVMQLSFKVAAIDDLRRVRERALAHGAEQMRGMNHGNALSIYFADIEGNTVEVYLDTPWYVPQPHGDPLDLTRSDAEIWAETEAICRADPGFQPVETWAAAAFGPR
ncbi:VOC family protein [Piscinibacter sakaiensis]|uniref:Putative ring-cleavage dioxygenase n=1 Tax=Piscinibacter sakaiensis TaxID=1547922 RepID=A0A0K8P085_PISS1|nr:VOC family protein [Piscinibacter sakaiensis]GAP35949.1 putative ring-cleavage dioxygenase [Piscinibacter sakaiensis]